MQGASTEAPCVPPSTKEIEMSERDRETMLAGCWAYGWLGAAAEEYERGNVDSAGRLLADGMRRWRERLAALDVRHPDGRFEAGELVDVRDADRSNPDWREATIASAGDVRSYNNGKSGFGYMVNMTEPPESTGWVPAEQIRKIRKGTLA